MKTTCLPYARKVHLRRRNKSLVIGISIPREARIWKPENKDVGLHRLAAEPATFDEAPRPVAQDGQSANLFNLPPDLNAFISEGYLQSPGFEVH